MVLMESADDLLGEMHRPQRTSGSMKLVREVEEHGDLPHFGSESESESEEEVKV